MRPALPSDLEIDTLKDRVNDDQVANEPDFVAGQYEARRAYAHVMELCAKQQKEIEYYREALEYIRDDLLPYGGEHNIPSVVKTALEDIPGRQ